jgi:Ribonuclease G/E
MSHFLYLMRCAGACKVGISANPQGRRDEMQTGNPYRIAITKAVDYGSRRNAFLAERLFHEGKIHMPARRRGEWIIGDADSVKAWFCRVTERQYSPSTVLEFEENATRAAEMMLNTRASNEIARHYLDSSDAPFIPLSFWSIVQTPRLDFPMTPVFYNADFSEFCDIYQFYDARVA